MLTGELVLPFAACTLVHIWPKEQASAASEIATELKLPEGFFTEPRSFLVLPKDVHDAFDSEALLFLPSRSGILVRKWRTYVLRPWTCREFGRQV